MAFTAEQLATSPMKNTESFSTKNPGSYNVKTRSYPTGITENADLQHYVTFFINVRGKSKIFATQKPSVESRITSGGENRVNSEALQYAAVGAVGIGAFVGIGRQAAKVADARTAMNGGTLTQRARNSTGTAVATAATAATAAAFLVQADTSYRISDAITLHIAQAPTVTYNASYDTSELGALTGVLAGGSSAVDTAKASTGADALKALMLASAKLPGNLVTSGNLKTAVAVATRENLNPYREVLFKSIGFRRFAFDYKFMPASQEETAAVFEIIKTFKYHMHPEMSQGGLYYIHPSEFNIQYYYAGRENKFFNKISTCVLEDMTVDYGGAEMFSSFNDGAPVEINMRLVFQETETLTKERIDQGF